MELQRTAPAKINLTLDISGVRPDGYHELATVMHQISLADTVYLSRQNQGITLDSGHPFLANDACNLAWRAADLMRKRYLPDVGVSIRIEKRIPIEAGLAGGSTDAAAVILGMNQLFDLHLPLEELCACGAQLGADVPFCIAGGTALCTGKGDVMQSLASGVHLFLVIVKPTFSLSTAAVYHHFDSICPQRHPDHVSFLEAWHKKNLSLLLPTMYNVLGDASLSLKPEIGLIVKRLLAQGALAAQMTGSGPAVFGIFPSAASAQEAAKQLGKEYPECFAAESFVAV